MDRECEPLSDYLVGLDALARIFNQDVFNLPKVQRGLRATQKPGVTLANYQEAKIRHFHALLEKWINT